MCVCALAFVLVYMRSFVRGNITQRWVVHMLVVVKVVLVKVLRKREGERERER